MMSDREAMESAELVIACYEEDGECKWEVLKDRRGEQRQAPAQAAPAIDWTSEDEDPFGDQ